ncbi:Down syndrome cell adhesion molecule-like protein 1 homolog [Geodia barretti]|uniref:Down syndrome cell adhesion molecule-like protein 1 homolog n=3 Tax=Geodia barretti TaxID=519541 RepID=A0AA35S682_GEOBA|nr:Down syndrome cell adhesion molecule-like protein 1 homolog [Geodia barretti]
MLAGAPLTLQCDFNLSASVEDISVDTVVTWTVGNTAVTTSGEGRRVYNSGTNLEFSLLTTSDTGRYTCTLAIIPQTSFITVDGPKESPEKIITAQIPPPVVTVSLSQNGPLYAGTSLTVTCTVTLDSSVNNNELVSTDWTGLDHVPIDRISTTPVIRVIDSSYTSTLTISPLADQDDGTLNCTGTATGATHIQSASNAVIDVIVPPAPYVTISTTGLSIAGQSYTFKCSASVVAGLVAEPHMKIVLPNTTEISVVATKMLNHTFSSLRISDGGQYTCTATINIPQVGATNIQSSVAKTLAVVYAYPVERLWSSRTTGTSITFYWSPPSIGAHLTMNYHLKCDPLLIELPIRQALVSATSTSAVITDLHPGNIYNCSIFTVGPLGNSEPKSHNITTPEIAPSGSPEMFGAVAGEREVEFSWSPPPPTQQNGVITSYTLSCSPSPSSLPQSPSSQSSGSLSVTGFSPNTLYSCSLTANNSQGSGPPATAIFTTQQDYAYFQLRLKGVLPCPNVIATLTEQKLKDVETKIIQIFKAGCAECSSNVLDEQSFSCFEESPLFLTYRARLEGTSERDSGSLVSLIEAWVRGGGASVIVTGVLMTVDSQCSVTISSLSDPECSKPSPPPNEPKPSPTQTLPTAGSDSTAAIIGGVVAIVLIIAIVVTIVVIAALILKNRRLTTKTAEKFEMGLVPGSPGVIPTSTNSAYHTVKKEGRVTGTYDIPLRAGDEGGYDIICPSPPPPPPPPSRPSPPPRPRPPSQQSLPKLPESEEEVYEVIPGEDN